MLNIVYALTSLITLVLLSFKPLSVIRQRSYRIKESAKVILKIQSVAIVILLVGVCYIIERKVPLLCCAVLCLYALLSLFYYILKRKSKRKITAKTLRLAFCYFLLCLPICVLAVVYKVAFCLPFIPFPVLCLAKIILMPYEKREEKKYERRAKAKIERIKPVIIAITGSYGKTTCKNVLAHLLSAKYNVCASPKSYNTPQGVCITINDYLKENDDVLILEMGARYKGDIQRLVNLVNPDYCVLTAIGNQHLQTFKTQEALIKEKLSIFSCNSKKNFYNSDCILIPKVLNAIACGKDGEYRYCNELKTENGWSFDFLGDDEQENVVCSLPASYIPQTVCMAFAVAKSLDIPMLDLKKRAKTLKEVAHRQQLLYNGKDVIIDDAYNSNESGFISAVDLLSTFSKKKIIITPGVVELGKSQFQVNEKLARYAKTRVDEILCYGVNSKAIKRGGEDKVKVFSSLKACMNYYETIKGDKAVLFENDLPDCY